jgi:enoyl-CoA hydratase
MTGISAQLRDGVLHVVLDRPEKLNAVNTPMLQELAARVRDGNQETVRAVLITGAGRAFCSGGDLSGKDTDGAAGAANDAVRSIVDLPKPVIAGVHGPASGFGCSLALACDLIVAARSAYFQLAFANVGLMPDGGASALIPASIGRQRAARMALLAERIPAEKAFEWGLISHVVDDVAYEIELATVVDTLAHGPTVSYQWIKRALQGTTLSELDNAQAIELDGQNALVRTADFRAAVKGFRTRQAPQFEGK